MGRRKLKNIIYRQLPGYVKNYATLIEDRNGLIVKGL